MLCRAVCYLLRLHCGLKGQYRIAQGKAEGRRPGLSHEGLSGQKAQEFS
jgi:hypothetical protein